MINTEHSIAIIAVITAVTVFMRFIPFALFAKSTPKPLLYLGKVLPYSIMAMLIVYCIKEVDILSGSHGIPELLSIGAVAVLHKLKHNTILSIVGGTGLYMFLIQSVFV